MPWLPSDDQPPSCWVGLVYLPVMCLREGTGFEMLNSVVPQARGVFFRHRREDFLGHNRKSPILLCRNSILEPIASVIQGVGCARTAS